MSDWPMSRYFRRDGDPAPRSYDELPIGALIHRPGSLKPFISGIEPGAFEDLHVDPDYVPAWQKQATLDEIRALIPKITEWKREIRAHQQKIIDIFHERYGMSRELNHYGRLEITKSQLEAIKEDLGPLVTIRDTSVFNTLAGIPFEVVDDPE